MRQRLTRDRNSFHVLLHLSNVVLGRVIVRLSLSIHVILDHVRSRRVLLRHFSTSNRLYGFTSTIAKAPLPKVATPTSDTQDTQGQRWCTRRLAGDYIFRKSRGATSLEWWLKAPIIPYYQMVKTYLCYVISCRSSNISNSLKQWPTKTLISPH